MNARTDLPAEAQLDLIPLQCIRTSCTHIQTLRRQHFNAEKLLELSASIQANGVLQPILVRPIPPDGTVQYEIVAGERRYLAADHAGLAHIPANIRALTDTQVLEAQLVENLQRVDLSALEEAEGFLELMDLTGINADAVAAKIGKSRSYVYARTKLLDLIPAAREALASGTLDASKGLILARIKGEKMQTRALKLMQENTWWSYRRLVEKLRDDFMTPLAEAAWLPDRDDVSQYVPVRKTGLTERTPIPACATCPHNSANDAELSAEVEGRTVCTDRPCFDLKTKLHWSRARQESEAAGRPVLTGDAAAAVVDQRGGYMGQDVKGNHVRLDAECDSFTFNEPEPEQLKNEPDEAYEQRMIAWWDSQENFKAPTYRQLLGALPETVLAEARAGQLVEVAPIAAVAKALKAKGIKVPQELKPQRGGQDDEEERVNLAVMAAERAKEEEREKVETEYRTRLLQQIHAKWKPPLKKHDLAYIAAGMLEGVDNTDAFDRLYDNRPDPDKLSEAELARFMVIYAINGDCDDYLIRRNKKPSALLDYAHRLKIDPKKIRAEVVKDLRPTSAAGEPEAKKKPAKK